MKYTPEGMESKTKSKDIRPRDASNPRDGTNGNTQRILHDPYSHQTRIGRTTAILYRAPATT